MPEWIWAFLLVAVIAIVAGVLATVLFKWAVNADEQKHLSNSASGYTSNAVLKGSDAPVVASDLPNGHRQGYVAPDEL